MSAFERNEGTSVRPFRLDRTNAKLMGVCGGIGEFAGIDPTLVRIGFVATTLLGFGAPVVIYLAIGLIAD
ncbi:PspC domain-containing protein [Altererythrobacter sp. CC-YST694]|uniref:PspC domain-containing protein n=1 Tax=Altererythrobacter sp. CC-YST694 TaxID=2755038 RepID=UPI001D02C09F|nr:PspC domain-containing protein [Altererythrobacter sp. CC-YST694]MCB5426340.1 PspC domain-containing protein [Altererythrobacter sp. CC-YST694]